jgi:hypothetical protein
MWGDDFLTFWNNQQRISAPQRYSLPSKTFIYMSFVEPIELNFDKVEQLLTPAIPTKALLLFYVLNPFLPQPTYSLVHLADMDLTIGLNEGKSEEPLTIPKRSTV